MQQIETFKAGFFSKSIEYKAFTPNNINQIWGWQDRELTKLVEKATLHIGQLDAYATLVPNIDHFIKMYVLKEATLSSKIEGTQTNMEEALLAVKDIAPERRNDWIEVNNYTKAINEAILGLQKLPLSSRILKQAHYQLLQGARGEHKLPGEYRRSQNWIGGSSLKNASFIPPLSNDVEALMGDLENFLHNDDTGLTHILKIALAHYQFETIHPFLDGNGRIGRLMITLYLVEQDVLKKPVLYLSDYFEKNKALYYEYLTRVRTQNDLLKWMKFFVRGVVETAENSIEILKEIIALKKRCEEDKIYNLGKKITVAKVLLDYLYQQPLVNVDDVATATKLSKVSSNKLIVNFEQLGILEELTGFKRNRMYIFKEYFNLFNQ